MADPHLSPAPVGDAARPAMRPSRVPVVRRERVIYGADPAWGAPGSDGEEGALLAGPPPSVDRGDR